MAKMLVRPPLCWVALFGLALASLDRVAAETTTNTATGGSRTVAELRWAGKDALAKDTNANYVLGLWNLPAGLALESATLSKLAHAPWRLAGKTNEPGAKTGPALLQPLLSDLLRYESFFRLTATERHRPSATLTIRLPEQRASLWSTNLAEVIRLRTGKTPVTNDAGWSLKRDDGIGLRLRQAGEWLVLTAGKLDATVEDAVLAAAEQPLAVEGTNRWLQVLIDFPYLAELKGRPVQARDRLPRTLVTLHGEGDYVRTLGRMEFPKPLDLDLQPWSVPTNLIHEPLISFSALQGINRWLSGFPDARKLRSDLWPRRLYMWALSTLPVHTFFAAPMTNAVEFMEARGPHLYAALNTWSTNNAFGDVFFETEQRSLRWEPLPLFTPTLTAVTNTDGEFLVATLSRDPLGRGAPIPDALLEQVAGSTNLVYYDWELTGERAADLIFVAQSWRMAFHRAQLPGNSLALKYIQALIPKLGNTVTEVTQTAPGELNLVRKSHLGLTGVELHLLADWLESPQFPRGLLTLLGPRSEVLRWNKATRSFGPRTNAPAAPRR